MKLAKPLFASLALAGALATAHGQAPAPADKSAKPAPTEAGRPGTMGVDTKKMQELLQKMHAQMDRLRATTDPAEQQKVMQEHMATVQEAMKGMRGRGGPAMGMMGGDPTGKTLSGTPPGSLDERMRMMESRMDLMQMKMDQMMQHEDMMQRK